MAGDSGWGAGIEGSRTFATGWAYARRIQPYLLMEAARVYSHLGTAAFSRLASASLGVRVADGAHYTVDVAVSKPLGDASPDNPRRRLRLSALVSYNFEKH